MSESKLCKQCSGRFSVDAPACPACMLSAGLDLAVSEDYGADTPTIAIQPDRSEAHEPIVSMSQELSEGTILINQYYIEGVLGQGGFGITYLALDLNLATQVAIKEFLPSDIAYRDITRTVRAKSRNHLDRYEVFRNRFLDEAQILAQVQHPNVVRVMNYFEANNTAYIVMEYVPGPTLSEELRLAGGFLEESRIQTILDPLLNGLEHVHKRGVIHRDIKPNNIIIREEDGQPVLIDFGAARQLSEVEAPSDAAILTPGFAPMEQYETHGRQQGAWTDLYALSAVLYHCLSGKTPDEATARIAVTSKGACDPLGNIKDHARTPCSPGLAAAITAGLAPLGDDRPASVTAWRERLSEPVSDLSAGVSCTARFQRVPLVSIPAGSGRYGLAQESPRELKRVMQPSRLNQAWQFLAATFVALFTFAGGMLG